MISSVLTRREAQWRRLGPSVAVAVLVHAAALALLARAPASRPRRAPLPLEVTLVRLPSPPPSPAGTAARTDASSAAGAAGRADAPRSDPSASARTRVVPPIATLAPEVATPPPASSSPPPEVLEPDGQPAGGTGGPVADATSGDAIGVGEGVIGGVGGVGWPAAPVDAEPAARVDFDDTMTPPRFLSGPEVEYVQQAVDREVEGTMVVRCVVTVQGAVHDCRVLKGLPFMDSAMVSALERRRYAAATLRGRPLDVNYTFRIRLVLPR
jgi:protein TonB